MDEKKRIDFCTHCRKEVEYTLSKRDYKKAFKDKEYNFILTTPICSVCGEYMDVPGLIDKNIKEYDEQFRAFEGIVSVEDIEKLLKIYKIGKTPLSVALGFGEVTINRYFAGQIPSKEYSDIIKKALSSPLFMMQKLKENKDKIAPAAYNKAIEAAKQIESLFTVSDKMLKVIACIFDELKEVTPLMLQKLLYFIQGLSLALSDKPIFKEDCQAWVHGPVYPDVYNLFRDFKYNPIDDARFAIFDGCEERLSKEERDVVDLVINSFGEYSAKVLEKITHHDDSWRKARNGYDDDVLSNVIISKDSIAKYYKDISKKYDLSSLKGIKQYIVDVIE